MFEVKIFDDDDEDDDDEDEDENVDNVQTVITHFFSIPKNHQRPHYQFLLLSTVILLLQGMVRQRHLYGGPRDPTDLPGQ